MYCISPELLFLNKEEDKSRAFKVVLGLASDFISLWRKFWSWKKFCLKTSALFWVWIWCSGWGGRGAGRGEWKLPERRGGQVQGETVGKVVTVLEQGLAQPHFLEVSMVTREPALHKPSLHICCRLPSSFLFSHLVEKSTDGKVCCWKCHQAAPFFFYFGIQNNILN